MNKTGGELGTALQAAAYYGPTSSIRYLLDHGADARLCSGKYGNALQAAAAPKHFIIDYPSHLPTDYSKYDKIDALIKAGANVNAEGGLYGTSLQAAALDGSDEVVKLLLENGAEVNYRGGKYGTALARLG